MRGALLLGALVMTAPAALHAQDVSVLVGGVSARYADSVSGSAGVVDGRVEVTRAGSTGMLDASVAAGPLFERTSGPFTTSISAAVGGARAVDSTTFLLGSVTVGARYDRGRWQVETAAVGHGADTLRFLDWTAGVTWSRPSLSLAATGGVRAGDLGGDPWGQLRVEATLNAALKLEASVGSYPRDVTGFTSGRFATVGIRVDLARDDRDLRTRSVVGIERLKGGRVRVTVALGAAMSVAIAGDWNDWSPAPMSRASGGRWSAVIHAAPGIHRFAILVDGTRWTVPQGAPQASDGFGGQAALLVIPDA